MVQIGIMLQQFLWSIYWAMDAIGRVAVRIHAKVTLDSFCLEQQYNYKIMFMDTTEYIHIVILLTQCNDFFLLSTKLSINVVKWKQQD